MSEGWSGPRIEAALDHLAAVEEASGRLPGPRPAEFELSGREARRLGVPPEALGVPFEPHQGGSAAPRRLILTSSADLIRFGKFGAPADLRLRAFYASGSVSVKLVVGTGRPLLSRELRLRRRLPPEWPIQVPIILEADVDRRRGYLIEPTVEASHPLTPRQRQEAADTLVGGLVELYRSFPIRHRRVRLAARRMLVSRLAGLAQDSSFEVLQPLARSLVPRAAALVGNGRRMATGLGHGDLVFSNIFLGPGDSITLIDWEHAHRMVLAADLVKVVAVVPDPMATLERLAERARGSRLVEGRRMLGLDAQLAVAALQALSWWEAKLPAARSAGRMANLESFLTARAHLAAKLLDRAGM